MTTKLLPILLLPILASCGSLFAPGPDSVSVSSTPSGATVYLDHRHVATTPGIVEVARSSEGVFTFELEGYTTVEIDRAKVVNGWAFPGCFTWVLFWPGIPISLFADAASGNIGKYSDEPLHVTLPLEAAPGAR